MTARDTPIAHCTARSVRSTSVGIECVLIGPIRSTLGGEKSAEQG